MDWTKRVDLSTAQANVEHDAIGDWYRDPWGWPEAQWAVHDRPELVAARLNASGARAVHTIDVPKERFAIRPAVVLDPLDRVATQALVDRILPNLFQDVASWVFGWRPNRSKPESGSFLHNGGEWDRYRAYLRDCADHYKYALRADVTSFFSSIDIDRLEEKLTHRSRKQLAINHRLISFLRAQQQPTKDAIRTGLPQRCLASSALANMYLADSDASLRVSDDFDEWNVKPTAIRWMDDYWIFADSEAWLRSVQVQLAEALAQDGLGLNSGKTDLLERDQIHATIDKFSHSAEADDPDDADDASVEVLRATAPQARLLLDAGRIEALLDQIVKDPSSASRTNIRFVARSIADLGLISAADTLASLISELPHGADHIARMTRRLRRWDADYLDAFEGLLNSEWPQFPWSIGQLTTAFPTTKKAGRGRRVGGLFQDLAERSIETNDLVLSVSVLSRLAAWAPDAAIALAEELISNTSSSFIYRAAALFMLEAGRERSAVGRILSSHEENFPVLLMLEDRGWQSPSMTSDFSGKSK